MLAPSVPHAVRPHEVHLALVPPRVPDAAASTAPWPSFVTTYDRPSPWAGMGDGYRNSEFR